MHAYKVAGIDFLSKEPFNGLPQSRINKKQSWNIAPNTDAVLLPASKQRGRFQCTKSSDGNIILSWPKEGSYWIEPDKRRVRYLLEPDAPREALPDTILGPIVSFILLLQGEHPLHASAVCIKDEAVAFAGQPGSGKSTTAAAFLLGGYGLIADDVLAIKWNCSKPYAMPGYPEIRLWPSSGRKMLTDFDSLPQLIKSCSKRKLDPRVFEAGFEKKPVLLRRIYELRRSSSASIPFIQDLSGHQAMLALVRNLYNDCLIEPQILKQQFNQLNRLAGCIRIKRLTLTRKLQDPAQLINLIKQDLAKQK